MIALLCLCLTVASLYPSMAEEYFESQRLSKDNEVQYSQRDLSDLVRSESVYESDNDNRYQKNNQYDNTNQATSYNNPSSGYAESQDNYQTSYNQIGYAPDAGYIQQGDANGYSQGTYAPDNGYNQGAQVSSYSQTGSAPVNTNNQGGIADPAQVSNYAQTQAPNNNYNYAQAPVTNYAQAPAANYAPSQTPGVTYAQTPVINYAPATNYVPAQAPINNYAPAQAPTNNYTPAQAPANYAPAQAPVNNYAPAQAPIANYAPAQAPIANYAPAQSPFANYAPAQAPLANYATDQAPLANYGPAQAPLANYAPVPNLVANIAPAPIANKAEDQAPATQSQVQRRIIGSNGCGGVQAVDNKLEVNPGFGIGSGLLGLGPRVVTLQDPQPFGILGQAIQQSVSSTRNGLANGIRGISDLAAAGINLQTGILGAIKAIPVRALNAVAVATNNLASIGRVAGDALARGQRTTTLGGGLLSG